MKHIFEPIGVAELDKTTNQVIKVKGVLSNNTVMSVLLPGYQLIKQLNEVVFDFEQVIYADSSALALLLAWIRFSSRLGKKISSIHMPRAMMEMAVTCRLENILSVSVSKDRN